MNTLERPRHRLRAGCLVALSICGALAGHGAIAAAAMDMQTVRRAVGAGMSDDGRIKVAVVIKGGVSLGSYEAGVNWTLLRFLKDVRGPGGARPQLLAAAGASAGAINGVLSAVYWCREDLDADTLENNFIRASWREIDIVGLLDEGRDPKRAAALSTAADGDACAAAEVGATLPLRPEDNGVFSRRALRKTEAKVKCLMSQPKFRANCEVAIGMTLTRADPVRVDNAGVEVANQRLVAPLLLKTTDGEFVPYVHDLVTADEALNRSIIFLDDPISRVPEPHGLRLHRDTLFDAIKASSSFPVAFAPIKLSYCLRYRNRDQLFLAGYEYGGSDRRCPLEHRRLTSYFVDGGVFDNDPIGLVRHLAESGGARKGAIQYVNIDPGRRRRPRGLQTIEAIPFSQPGDSIDVELLSGQPAAGLDYSPTAADTENVSVWLCDAAGNKIVDFDLELYETGFMTRRFLGALHTVPADPTPGARWAGRTLKTRVGEQIRFFPRANRAQASCAKDFTAPHSSKAFALSAVVAAEPQGLSTQIGFIGGAVESARTAQLYQEVIGQAWADGLTMASRGNVAKRPLYQPARLTPLVGDYILAFGAFLDERFRDFDYYAGVFDAVYGFAEFYCYRAGDHRERCLSDTFREIYLSLCPECGHGAATANTVMRHLIVLDMCGAQAIIDSRAGCDLAATDWAWIDDLASDDVVGLSGDDEGCELNQTVTTRPALTAAAAAGTVERNELAAIGRALLCADELQRNRDRDPFIAFVQRLAEDPRFARDPTTPLGRMLAKYQRPVATWYYPLAKTAVAQLLPLERRDQKIRRAAGVAVSDLSGTAKTGLATFGLAVETAMADHTGWQWHLSTVPRDSKWSRLAPWLPNEVAVDTRNGGMDVYWEAGWRSRGKWGASLRAAPYLRQRIANQTVEFAELTGFLVYKTNNPALSSFGIGPTVTYAWTDPSFGTRDTLGASVFVGLLGEKLRITYGVRSFSRDDFEGDDIFWQLSLRDLPGFAYWGLQTR